MEKGGVKLHTWALITLTRHKTELDLIPPPFPIPLNESITQRWPVLHCFLDSPIKIKKHPHLDNYSLRLEWSGTWQQQHGRPRESVIEVLAVRDPDRENERKRKRKGKSENKREADTPRFSHYFKWLERERERGRGRCVYTRAIYHHLPLSRAGIV